MKVLFVDLHLHHKNKNALLKYNFNIDSINTTNLDNIDLTKYDVVYSPGLPINVNKYINTKFLFGPHFSIQPDYEQMNLIRGNNCIYVQPSNWAKNIWKKHIYCNNIRIESLPFGVDTNKFNEIKHIKQRTEVFVYFKHRNPIELDILAGFLHKKAIEAQLFSYGSYSEQDYIDYLHKSKYGIWLDAHESQGFALEEALSCNVPLLVWNVTSMNQEHGQNYDDIPASSIPYWDERCGEYFYNADELEQKFNTFISNLEQEKYKPREYIVDNISIEKCEQKFADLVNQI